MMPQEDRLHRDEGAAVVTVHQPNLHLYPVTEEQLDNIASGSSAWEGLAGACLGAFASLLGVLLTAGEATSPTASAILASLTVTFGLATLVLGALAFQSRCRQRQAVRRIKEMPIPVSSINHEARASGW